MSLQTICLALTLFGPAWAEDYELTLSNERNSLSLKAGEEGGFFFKLDSQSASLEGELHDAAVFQNGQTVAISDFKVAGRKQDEIVHEAFLPKNPLTGHTPHSRIEFLYYRPDETDKMQLRRTMRLLPGLPAVEILYRVTNTGDKASWFCLRLASKFREGEQQLAYLMPSVEGVSGRPKPKDEFPSVSPFPHEYDTAETWLAFIGKRASAITAFEPDKTSCLARPNGNNSGGCVTTENLLKPGESWETKVRWIMVPGLKRVDAADNENVFSVDLSAPPVRQGRAFEQSIGNLLDDNDGNDEFAAEDLDEIEGGVVTVVDKLLPWPVFAERKAYLPEEKISVYLNAWSTREQELTVAGVARRVVSGEEVKLGTKKVKASATGLSTLPFEFKPMKAGTWLLRFEIRSNDETRIVERAFVIDWPAGIHLPAIYKGKKVGKVFDRFRYEKHRAPHIYDPLSMAFPLTTKMQTPHLPYAKKLAGGPLRLMVTIPFRRAREPVELMLRLDCDMEPIIIGSHGYAGPGSADANRTKSHGPTEEIRAIRRALANRPEVILLAATVWYWFPFDLQREIMRQVAEDGTGLLFCAPLEMPPEFRKTFPRKIPWGTFHNNPEILPFGKGRVGFRGGQAATPHYEGIFARTEDSLEAISRGLILIARGEPDVRIKWEAPETYEPQTTLTVTNKGKDAFKGKVELRIWMDLEKSYPDAKYAAFEERGRFEESLTLASGKSENIKFNLPKLPLGTYRLMVFLKDAEGNTRNWQQKIQRNLPPLDIEELQIGHGGIRLAPRLNRHDEAVITFKTKARAVPEKGPFTAYVTAFDRSDRVLIQDERQVELKQGEVIQFKARLDRALHRHFLLRAGIRWQGQVIGESRIPVMVDRTDRYNKFRFVLLDNENWFPHHTVLIDDFAQGGYWWVAELDARGFGYGGFHGDPDAISAEEWQAIENQKIADAVKAEAAKKLNAIADLKDNQDNDLDDLEAEIEAEEAEANKPKDTGPKIFTRGDCFNRPDHREFYRSGLIKRVRESSGGWAQRYFVDDEYRYGSLNTCQCEHCQKAFHRYLKVSYGSVDRLNQEWQTSFKSIAEAKLMHFKDENTPPSPKEIPPAVDTLKFKAWQYRDTAVTMKEAVRKEVDPDFDIGASGVYKMERGGFLKSGIDHWYMASMGGFHTVYRDHEEWTSFAGTPNVVAWQSGYGGNYNPSHQAWHPWERLFNGHFGIGHFTSNHYPMAQPDGRLHAGAEAFFKNWDKIRHGPGELLLGKEDRAPVAIHWSGHSHYVCGVERWVRDGKPSSGLLRWMTHSIPWWHKGRRLRNWYISQEQLANGIETYFGEPNLLVMNYSAAVSKEEAETVKKFISEGGLLLAGIDTATRSEHGFPWKKPLLDEVLGIEHTGGWQPVIETNDETEAEVTYSLPGQIEKHTFKPKFLGPNVKATTATSHGTWKADGNSGKAFFINSFGKGKAVYLNFPIVNVHGAENGRIMEWSYGIAGIDPFASSTGLYASRFVDGNNRYVCMLAPYGKAPSFYEEFSKNVSVTLNEKRHVYDSRVGKYLGFLNKFNCDFTYELVARWYACLPYKVTGLELSESKAVKAGEVVKFAANIQKEGNEIGRHVLRVEVTRPDGELQKILGYNQNVIGGNATIEIPLGLNAPKGNWKVELRDVVSGVSASREFDVR